MTTNPKPTKQDILELRALAIRKASGELAGDQARFDELNAATSAWLKEASGWTEPTQPKASLSIAELRTKRDDYRRSQLEGGDGYNPWQARIDSRVDETVVRDDTLAPERVEH